MFHYNYGLIIFAVQKIKIHENIIQLAKTIYQIRLGS